MIQGICGRTFYGSSAALEPQGSDLLSLWESKLAERLAMVGSTEFALIWRRKVTPAGHEIFRLSRSTRHTNGTAFTGSPWATLTLHGNFNVKGMSPTSGDGLCTQMLATWTTPSATDSGNRSTKFAQGGSPLPMQMAAWPTVMAEQHRQGMAERFKGDQSQNGRRSNLNDAMTAVAAWSTPRASDGEKGGPNMAFSAGGQPLPAQMHSVSTWSTPTTNDAKNCAAPSQFERNSHALNVQLAATAASGPTPNGSSATTVKRAVPNPAFPFWLMGFPDEWISGALRATRSLRSSRRK